MFEATLSPGFTHYVVDELGAALGYRRAGQEPLYIEQYLDVPAETAVTLAFSRPIARGQIIELGNFAGRNAVAMINLWGTAANDLGGHDNVAVATLTAPLRRMFRRIGQPFADLAPAREFVARSMGIVTEIVLTDGSQPIGRGIGPVLEARDVMAVKAASTSRSSL